MKRIWILLLSLILLLIPFLSSGAYLYQKVSGSVQPHPGRLESIGQNRTRDCGTAQPTIDVKIIERRRTPHGPLLVYRASCFAIPEIGHVSGSMPDRGHPHGDQDRDRSVDRAKRGRLEYRTGQPFLHDRGTTILYGQTSLPNIAEVEATFGNGQVDRTDVENGRFTMLIHHESYDRQSWQHPRTTLESLRLFDANGRIIFES